MNNRFIDWETFVYNKVYKRRTVQFVMNVFHPLFSSLFNNILDEIGFQLKFQQRIAIIQLLLYMCAAVVAVAAHHYACLLNFNLYVLY